MKKSILILQLVCLSTTVAMASETYTNDTTYQFNDKTIDVSDVDGQIDVKIYKVDQNGNETQYKSVYEGVFSDDKSYEKYTVLEDLGFQIPALGKNKKHKRYYDKMQAHWAGLLVGYSNMVQEVGLDEYNLAKLEGVSIRPENSLEWSLNTNEFIVPLYKDVFGLTTGFGFTWRNYCLDGNYHMEEIDNFVKIVPAAEGITYRTGRLRTLHLCFPLMLEWQPRFGDDHSFFVTAGVVGGIKAFANYRVTYKDRGDNTIKIKTGDGLNVPPLTLDYLVQAGYKDFGFFAKYSPLSFFMKEEGPEAQAVSIGVTFQFND